MAELIDVLKADGVHLITSYRNKWLGDPYYEPIFAELHRRKAVLYTHPVVPDFAEKLIPDVPDTVIEIGTDTTRTIASLLFSGTAAGRGLDRPAAGKTGTTQNNRDAWFMGYTPTLATCVWMGYPDATRPMENVWPMGPS